MPKDFIKIDREASGQKYATDLISWVSMVRSVIDVGEALVGHMLHNIDGSDYADVETLFGLPTGNGDEVYNLAAGTLAGIKGTAQSADALTLIDRVG